MLSQLYVGSQPGAVGPSAGHMVDRRCLSGAGRRLPRKDLREITPSSHSERRPL